MSDMPVETGAPAEEAAPIEGGESVTEAPPEPSYFDPTDYSDHHVRLKVDGEEVSVPLSEALGGYQRQADYTRKTQQLAEEQRRAQFGLTLQQALENNPQETLRILQAQYLAEQQAEAQEPDDSDWTNDPNEVRIRELDQRLARYEQQQADTQLRQAVGVLQQRYGDDFNPTEVVQAAFSQGRMDLENVFKEIAYDRYRQGMAAATEQQAAEEARRVAAKTQASQATHSGNGANNAVEPSSGSLPTIEEAFAEAKRSHGWQ
jgi:hypothetical protein